MKLRLFTIAAALSALPSFAHAQSTVNPFGVLIQSDWNANGVSEVITDPNVRVTAAINAHAPYLRTAFRNMSTKMSGSTWPTGDGAWTNYVTYVDGGLNCLVNFGWNNAADGMNYFVTAAELTSYGDKLGGVLDQMAALNVSNASPAVVVIENEEANIGYYGTDDRKAYLDQLAKAVTVVHAKGLKVTNGGLTDDAYNLFAWDYYTNRSPNVTLAAFFHDKLLSEDKYWTDATHTTLGDGADHAWAATKLAIARLLINGFHDDAAVFHKGYKTIGLDYINVHWYNNFWYKNGDPADVLADHKTGLEYVVTLLTQLTGIPVITNEIGLRTDDQNTPIENFAGGSTTTVRDTMNWARTTLNMPYIIWYSGPATGTGASNFPIALCDSAGGLTGYGLQFRHYIGNNNLQPQP